MPDVLDRFAREYQTYNGLSSARIVEQQRMLHAFEEHAGKSLEECSGVDLAAWLATKVESGLHVNTVRKHANMVRPFFTWGFSAGVISAEQLMSIRETKNPRGSSGRTKPKPYSSQELTKFRKDLESRYPLLPDYRLNYYFDGRAKFPRIRRHARRIQVEAIVALALYCGLRRREIYELTIDECHPENAYVVVRQRSRYANGKDKVREVPHTKQSREAVQSWLDFRDRLGVAEEKLWLSLDMRGNNPFRPMPFGTFQGIGGRGWSLHRFRHTCATLWLRSGMPLEVVSRLLGHSSINQTLCYAQLVRDDIVKAAEKHQDRFEELVNGN